MADIRQLVRVGNTDLNGSKQVIVALRKIKGVGFSFANGILKTANIPGSRKAGELSTEDIKKIEDIMKNPSAMPNWMLNRRADYESGEDKHIVTVDLAFTKENDIKRMKKIKCYKGTRHSKGLPVRGQRTKGHFRRGKSLGVTRKKGKAGKV